MELGHSEKNRCYVETMLKRLTQATDDCCLFLEKKHYALGEPVVLVIFLAYGEDNRPFAVMNLAEVIDRIEHSDFDGISGLSLGLVGGDVTFVSEQSVCVNSWASVPTPSNYHLPNEAIDAFHDYDDEKLYTWHSPLDNSEEASLTEVDYTIITCLRHSEKLDQFLYNIIEGLTQICKYDAKEEIELVRQIHQIQKNIRTQSVTVVH